MGESNIKTSGDNTSTTNSIYLQRGREYQSFQDGNAFVKDNLFWLQAIE